MYRQYLVSFEEFDLFHPSASLRISEKSSPIGADRRILLSFEAYSKQAVRFIRHVEEEQTLHLLQACAEPHRSIDAVRQPVIAQDVAVVPEFLDHGSRLS